MLYTHRTHSIINIVPQTAEFVYDLTTAEAVTAEFKHGLSASALDDAITSCSQVIATLCDRVFALQTVIEEFNIAFWDHRDALIYRAIQYNRSIPSHLGIFPFLPINMKWIRMVVCFIAQWAHRIYNSGYLANQDFASTYFAGRFQQRLFHRFYLGLRRL